MKQFASAILIVALAANAQHKVTHVTKNTMCKNDNSCVNQYNPPLGIKNCLCSLQVYRASCGTSTTTCPNYSQHPELYVLLPNGNNLTTTVDSTGSVYQYNDTSTALTDNSIWVYALTNKWIDQSVPSGESGYLGSAALTIPLSNVKHQATLNYQSKDCTDTVTCWIQVYRAVCPTPSTCPVFSAGYYSLSSLAFPVWQATPTGTIWQVVDNDPALVGSTTYAYVASACYTSNCQPGTVSTPWIGTTIAGSLKGKKPCSKCSSSQSLLPLRAHQKEQSHTKRPSITLTPPVR